MIEVFRQITGLDVAPGDRLDGDLRLDSIDLAALCLRLPGLDAHLASLELDQLIDLTVADVLAWAEHTPRGHATRAPTMRVLCVSLPLSGHVNPISAVAAELTRRAHTVAWAGSESFLRPVLGPGATVYPIPLRLHRGQSDRGFAAVRSRWAGYIVPHARYTMPAIERAVLDFRPDVLVVDQHAVGGAVVAHRLGLPWVTAAPTAMELTRAYRAFPEVERWIAERLAEFWVDGDPRFSPYRVLAFTCEELSGPADVPVTFVGAVLGPRPAAAPVALEDRRRVLVTMGTLAQDLAADFYGRAAAALADLDVQAILATPDRPPVPVLDLLPHLHAVIGHGGLNTVCESLAHGVPLVVAPVKDDQLANASRVAAVGAGIRVNVDRATPDELRAAVGKVLDDTSGARRIQQSLLAAGGAPAAADAIERLAS